MTRNRNRNRDGGGHLYDTLVFVAAVVVGIYGLLWVVSLLR